MKNLIALLVFALTLNSCGQDKKTEQEDGTTIYYLIRHAEKDRSDATNRNPNLNADGKERAERWNAYLKDVDFDMVYSTDYNRTRETATPIAKREGVDISIYDPRNMASDDFKTATNEKTVLIVGHSNTTPVFANSLLGEKKYEMMADDNNSNLYIVTIKKDGTATSELKVVD